MSSWRVSRQILNRFWSSQSNKHSGDLFWRWELFITICRFATWLWIITNYLLKNSCSLTKKCLILKLKRVINCFFRIFFMKNYIKSARGYILLAPKHLALTFTGTINVFQKNSSSEKAVLTYLLCNLRSLYSKYFWSSC